MLCDEVLRARAPKQPFLEALWVVKKVQESAQRYIANQISPTCTPEDSGSGMYYGLELPYCGTFGLTCDVGEGF